MPVPSTKLHGVPYQIAAVKTSTLTMQNRDRQGGPKCRLCPTSVDPLRFRNRPTSLFPHTVVYPTCSYKRRYSKPKPATSALGCLMETIEGTAGENGGRVDLEVFSSIIAATNWIYCNGFSGLVTSDLPIFMPCVWPTAAVNCESLNGSDNCCSVLHVKEANFKDSTFSR